MTSKTQNVGEGGKKCRSFQFKTSRYNYEPIYMNPRKEFKHTKKENYQTTMGETKSEH